MIDLRNEQLVAPKAAARLMPGRNGRPMAVTTIYRHMFKGSKGYYLEHVRVGGLVYTSIEAIERFVAALTALDAARMGPAPAPTGAAAAAADRAVRRGDDLVEARLMAAGL
jgi:hypothetical protein